MSEKDPHDLTRQLLEGNTKHELINEVHRLNGVIAKAEERHTTLNEWSGQQALNINRLESKIEHNIKAHLKLTKVLDDAVLEKTERIGLLTKDLNTAGLQLLKAVEDIKALGESHGEQTKLRQQFKECLQIVKGFLPDTQAEALTDLVRAVTGGNCRV